jgi:hypothetical protein
MSWTDSRLLRSAAANLGASVAIARTARRWRATALSTAAANRAAAERAMRRLYADLEFGEPLAIVWVRSPLEGCVTVAALQSDELPFATAQQVPDRWLDIVRELRASGRLGEPEWDAAMINVGVRGWSALGEQLHHRARCELELAGTASWREALAIPNEPRRLPIRAHARCAGEIDASGLFDLVRLQAAEIAEIDAATSAPPRRSRSPWRPRTRAVCEAAHRGRYGQRDAALLGARGALEAARVVSFAGKTATAQRRLARAAGWWWALRDVAIICERPIAVHVDDRGRPHRTDGPAIVYRDGWAVFAHHGSRVSRTRRLLLAHGALLEATA